MKSGAAGVARSGVGTIEGLHHGAHVVPVFLGGRSQGVFSRWFDLWESIGIHGILMGFWWDFHGTWWDFFGFSWDFIIRILARALDYVNSSKFGIWSLKKNTHSKLGFQQEEAGKFTNKWGQQIGWGLFFRKSAEDLFEMISAAREASFKFEVTLIMWIWNDSGWFKPFFCKRADEAESNQQEMKTWNGAIKGCVTMGMEHHVCVWITKPWWWRYHSARPTGISVSIGRSND